MEKGSKKSEKFTSTCCALLKPENGRNHWTNLLLQLKLKWKYPKFPRIFVSMKTLWLLNSSVRNSTCMSNHEPIKENHTVKT